MTSRAWFGSYLSRAALPLAILLGLPGSAIAPALAQQSGHGQACRCQERAEIAGRTLVDGALRGFALCADAVAKCVQEQPGDEACLARATSTCASALRWHGAEDGGLETQFAGQAISSCAGLDDETLWGEGGLHHASLSCAAWDDEEPTTLEGLTQCMAREHLCRALQVFSVEVPRARELLALGGVDLDGLECLVEWDGLGGSEPVERSPEEARALARCQATLTHGGRDYLRTWLKFSADCVNASYACAGDPTCLQQAAALCEEKVSLLETASRRAIGTRFLGEVGRACAADGDFDLDDVLEPGGLGFAGISDRCAALEAGGTGSLDDLAECVRAEHACRAQQMLLRQVPRAAELFEAAGVDPAQFSCLHEEVSAFVCGNEVLEGDEECDPPGTVGACGSGSRCSTSCECVTSNPPLITASPLELVLSEGEQGTVTVSATDPDGEHVSVTATPGLTGATFHATSGPEAGGEYVYTAGYEQQGLHRVSFTARDPWGLTDTVTVDITVDHVNRAPVLAVQESALVDEGDILTVPVTATDPDGDVVTVTAAPLPDNALFLPATGTLSFTPDYDQAGIYEITFEATDGSLWADPAVLQITVQDVETGGPGQPGELVLEVDDVESPTLVKTQRITGRVNPTGEEPPPARITSALITGLSPAAGAEGASLTVVLSGEIAGEHATHFVDGLSHATFGAGVTVSALDVASASSATATISIDPGAGPGPRQVTVTTGEEVAVSVLAFQVTAGVTSVWGQLVESTSGEPVSPGTVSLAGTTHATDVDAAGLFTLSGVPSGRRQLVANAPDHDLKIIPLDLRAGVAHELGPIEMVRNVYDPDAPAGASLFSVIGRGVADLTGRLTVDEAGAVIRDTLILVGGSEAGVLDEYGNQLNPNVEGDGLMSLEHQGVELYADRLSKGESVSLIEVLSFLSFGLDWGGNPPRLVDFLDALQDVVDEAWASPGDPLSASTIAIFNPDGRRMSPNPPAIDGSTVINRFQAYLLASGFMAETAKRLGANDVKQGFGKAPTNKADGESGYTYPWSELCDTFGSCPGGPAPSSGSGSSSDLPDYERMLREYYFDHSEETLEAARNMLLDEFPELADHFEEDPWGVKEAYDDLLELAGNDPHVQQALIDIVSGDSGPTPNLWATMSLQKGRGMDLYHGFDYIPNELKVQIISRSWAPSTPVMIYAEETSQEYGPPDQRIVLPAVRVMFYRSGDDEGDANPADTDFHYRLWRLQPKIDTDVKPHDERTGQSPAQLVMVGFGQIEDRPGGDRAPGEVRREDTPPSITWHPNLAEFTLVLPPAGMNTYRIDVIRRRGEGTPLGDLDPDSDEFAQAFRPWLSGFYDDPQVIDPTGGVGRREVHPGQGYLNGYTYEVSPLSNPYSVYIAGPGNVGKVDLAADYDDPAKIYISVPALIPDETSRARGMIFRYDANDQELSAFAEPGFPSPGPAGLAIDNNSNLYAVNGASEPTFGGRIFRYIGYRHPDEPPYSPAYGGEVSKLHVGQVNYYSRLLSRAQPSATSAIAMGPVSPSRNAGPELYVADAMKSEIKRLPAQGPESQGWDAWFNTADLFAWSSPPSEDDPPDRPLNRLNLNDMTDIAFARQTDTLYVSQGSRVVSTPGGRDASFSITSEGTIFTRAAGVAVCESRDGDVLFVADDGPPGDNQGVIYRIPVGDIPFHVPNDDPVEKARIQSQYLFLAGLEHPSELRITNSGRAFVFTDSQGLRYKRFGYTGRAFDQAGNPLVGAVVTIKTLAGTQSTVTDDDGYYNFTGRSSRSEAVVYAHVKHPDYSYVDRVTLTGSCNSSDRPAPCISITSPEDGEWTAAASVTVHGWVHPKEVDFTEGNATLDVTHGAVTTSYPLEWTGNDNEFLVDNVSLEPGDNRLVVKTDPAGEYGPGYSLTTDVRRTTTPAITQTISELVLDEDLRPRAGVDVTIFVDGEVAAETTTDGCGYFTVEGLPLGVVTYEVEGAR